MANMALTTAGILVKWQTESSIGTRPTTNYTAITGIKSIPTYNPEPSNLDTTTLENTEFKTYIPGLKDPGGALGLVANESDDFQDDWNAMYTAWETAAAAGKALWIEYAIPNHDSLYYTAIPSKLGFNGAEVDSVLENTGYLTPTGEPVWAAASTVTP